MHIDMVSAREEEKKRPFSRLMLGKRAKPTVILAVAIVGAALLMFGGMAGGGESEGIKLTSDFGSYAESVEQKVYELCSSVAGVSDVRVAVSFERGFEYVYAREEGAGKYLVVGSGSSESAVRVTEKTPVIGGIGVVCKGGGDPAIQNKLRNLISAAFGVKSNKIYVTEAAK